MLRLLSNSTTRTYQHALVILDVDTSGVQGLGLEEWLANKIFCMMGVGGHAEPRRRGWAIQVRLVVAVLDLKLVALGDQVTFDFLSFRAVASFYRH